MLEIWLALCTVMCTESKHGQKVYYMSGVIKKVTSIGLTKLFFTPLTSQCKDDNLIKVVMVI